MVTYSYDAWGNILSTSGTLATTLGVNNPIRYRGYYYDEESGFYYLGSRYYDPYYGSFISKDSVESGDLWVYCDNDPVNNVDPTGYWIDTALDVISLTLSVYDLVKDPTWENGAYVALDVAFLALPFVAGAGASLKFVSKADDIVDATRAVGKLDDMVDAGRGMANVMDAVSDTGRVVNKATNKVQIATGNVKVYRATKAGQDYYGITNNLLRRNAEHSKNGLQIIETLDGSYTRSQARSIEQVLIENGGGAKSKKPTTTLLNRINSISDKNPNYNFLRSEGQRLLSLGQWVAWCP